MQQENPFEIDGQWYKANLHCHSTMSDGDTPPAGRVEQYRDKGYDILALTDHMTTNDVSVFNGDSILVISGMEDHPDCPYDGNIYHLVYLNVPHGFTTDADADANERIKAVRAIGGEVIVAHPYWCGHNINHINAVSGNIALEVYNATCSKIGKAISSVIWDDLLDAGRVLGGIAVDDVHKGRDIFMGWTMIKASELTIDAVMESLRRGLYYATQGPIIEDFRIEDGQVLLRCSEVVEIHLVSKRAQGHSVYAEKGQTIRSASREVTDILGYIRAEIVDAAGLRAWSNPLILS